MNLGNLSLPEFPVMLAPMEDITDPPFRRLCKQQGADVLFTEFISSDGLIRDAVKTNRKLQFSDEERPLGIQLFGNEVESMVEAAHIAREADPDFIDLNFGCPVRKIVNKGGGAALLRDIPLMLQITRSVVNAVDIPVTVKTRLGWDEGSKIIVELAEQLQDAGIQMLTVHGRTRAQLYSGTADWTLIGQVKANPRMKIPVIGNGDVVDFESARHFRELTGVDGIMIGRGSVGNPWIFAEIKAGFEGREYTPVDMEERIKTVRSHLAESIRYKGERTAILEMRRHYVRYFRGVENFKPYRMALLTATERTELERVFTDIENIYVNMRKKI